MKKSLMISGSTLAVPHRWLVAPVQVAAGLGLLLLLALAGCTRAAPSGLSSQNPEAADTASETPGDPPQGTEAPPQGTGAPPQGTEAPGGAATPLPRVDDTYPLVSVVADSTHVQEGSNLSFTLTADPAPAIPLTVNLEWSMSRSGHRSETPDTVTIPTSGEAEIVLPTMHDYSFDDTTVEVVVLASKYYSHDRSPASITVRNDDSYWVTVVAGAATVDEGDAISFTLTATPAPASPLTVNLNWPATDDRLAGALPDTVTIPMSGTLVLPLTTTDDSIDNPSYGRVSVQLVPGHLYAPSRRKAEVTIVDND